MQRGGVKAPQQRTQPREDQSSPWLVAEEGTVDNWLRAQLGEAMAVAGQRSQELRALTGVLANLQVRFALASVRYERSGCWVSTRRGPEQGTTRPLCVQSLPSCQSAGGGEGPPPVPGALI